MSLRVTNGYLSHLLLGDLNRNLTTMLRNQRMAGSMQRINEYADDPRAVATIQRYNALIKQNDDFLTNTTRSRMLVDATDSALQEVSNVLADARVIMLRESSAQANQGSMTNAAAEVDGLINRLMDVLNTSIDGNYIFAGTETNAPPFLRSNGAVIYQGNEATIDSRVGPNSLLTVNLPGNLVMGARSASLHGSVDMAPRLAVGTALADLNLGIGWTPGAIQVEDGTGSVWQVDLSNAVTIDDVLTAISADTGGAVTAAISADGSALTLSGTGPLTVREDGDSTTASSLGIWGTSAGSTLSGRDVRAAADAATPLAEIEALAGSLPLGAVEIEWQGTVTTVDLSGAATLGDLQAAIAAGVPGMELQIGASGLVLVGSSPEPFQVRDADPTNTASALGLAGTGSPVRLFGVLEDLMVHLRAEDKAAVRDSASELASLGDAIQELLMRNGNRQNDLDWAESVLRTRDERLHTNLSLEQDVDVARVATDLTRAETAYQASLAVTAKLFRMNLIQYL